MVEIYDDNHYQNISDLLQYIGDQADEDEKSVNERFENAFAEGMKCITSKQFSENTDWKVIIVWKIFNEWIREKTNNYPSVQEPYWWNIF